MGYQRVLVPVSGKYRLERAARSLEQALQIVREDGEIYFFHCVDEIPHLVTGEAHRKLVMEDTREAEKLLEPLVQRVRNAGIAYSVHIAEGSPVTHIPRFASEKKVNVVIVCTGGHSEPIELVMGSVTERVFKYLSVPLLVVR
ncbi:MAG: universal stress protein [Betaproteobacteria bacterium]|nr:universal stress protein [Betaproteobacteria bacterium]